MRGSFALQIVPTAPSLKERLRIIDAVIARIAQSGLTYEVGAFETTVEGDFDELMNLLKELHLESLNAGAEGVASYVKFAFPKADEYLSIEDKVAKHRH